MKLTHTLAHKHYAFSTSVW